MSDELGWASPGAEADVPVASPTGPPAARPAASVPTVATLGPRTPTQILDDALSFIGRNPGAIFVVTAVVVVPFALLAAYLQRNLLGGAGFFDAAESSDPSVFAADADSGGGSALAQFAVLIGPQLALSIVTAGVAALVVAERTGRPADRGAALTGALKRSPILIWTWVLVHLAEAVGAIAIGFGALVAMVGLSVTVPVLAIERLGPLKAMRRSWRLTSRRWGPVFGICLLVGVVTQLLSQALSVLPTIVAGLIGFDVGWIILGVGAALIQVLTTAFAATTAVETYFDLRVRTEALDIQMQIPAVFGEARA